MSEFAMRAVVLTGAGELKIDEVPLPQPGPGQVLIRLEGCGVCASNLTPWEGAEWMRFPTEPGALGHEGWGIVDVVGPGVTELKPGDRVAARSGKAYAEFDVADASQTVKLPDSLANLDLPLEPFGCAMNVFRRSDIGQGQTVAIVGIDFLGAILVALASNAGARVIAISRRQESLDLARLIGPIHPIPMDDHYEVIERVREITGGVFCDRVIEAVGKQEPLDLAAELTREGGRLIDDALNATRDRPGNFVKAVVVPA
jgi:threonine dehydrogenase-like Zn-dependent dehydrogenase